jgi:hypothetical protein
MCFILPWFADPLYGAINEPNITKKLPQTCTKDTLSSNVGHLISLPNALLMHDAMNNASSLSANLDQFHMNVSYLMTLSCFM